MLIIAASAQGYFREALESSLKKTNVSLTQDSKAYLVHLLTEFTRSDKAFSGLEHGEFIVLAEVYERALKAENREAIQIFKHLGDSSLYLLGFFNEYQKTRILSESYYESMGAEAYLQTSNLIKANEHTKALFYELSEQFGPLVQVFRAISVYGDNRLLS